MTKKTKKHIHNWREFRNEKVIFWGEDDYVLFYCHCGKAKKVMVEEEKK